MFRCPLSSLSAPAHPAVQLLQAHTSFRVLPGIALEVQRWILRCVFLFDRVMPHALWAEAEEPLR
jgi:hypothetical protein